MAFVRNWLLELLYGLESSGIVSWEVFGYCKLEISIAISAMWMTVFIQTATYEIICLNKNCSYWQVSYRKHCCKVHAWRYICCLDAFDLVNHKILFNRLLERDFPAHLTRFLLFWYKDQQMSVRWLTSLSDSFPISNGVRQGGVLSPILFTIYIDDLLNDLCNVGVGCHWNLTLLEH